MKDFFQLREELQQLNESGMTDALNDLQDFWNMNAKQFMNQSNPLFPMFARPYDRIVTGGVMIVGINPGSAGPANAQRKELYKVFSGKQPPVWDKEKRRWRQVDVGRGFADGDKNQRKEKKLRFSQLTPEFEKRGGSTQNKYTKGWRNLLKALDREDLASKIMMTNLVPFPSTGKKSFPKGAQGQKMMELSYKWLREYIKVAKPSVVIVAGTDGWKAIKPMMSSEVSTSEISAISKTGSETNSRGGKIGSILKVGKLQDGTPVLNFMHPSSQSGQPTGPTYKDPNKLKQIRQVFNRYVP